MTCVGRDARVVGEGRGDTQKGVTVEFVLIGLCLIGVGLTVRLCTVRSGRKVKFKREKIKKPTERKSDAYVQGYKDMVRYGLGFNTTFEETFSSQDIYYFHYPYSDSSGNSVPSTVIFYKTDGTPYFSKERMMQLARSVMNKKLTIDVDAGQQDKRYLGGTEQEFADYYAGGMKFLEDLDQTKGSVVDEKIEKENVERLIRQRKTGLSENNRKIVLNMEALDELRANAFKPQVELSERKSWDRQMSELEGK